MQASYTKNYFKIYFWMGLSFALNFLSMIIVVPMITKTPAIYGIYSICISATVFLSYADLGFLGAAYKFASEAFARKETKQEIQLLGFANFILLVCVAVYAIVILTFAFRPSLIIKNLVEPNQIIIARQLLTILAVFSPIIILQRCLQLIFSIRLQDYIYQRITIILNAAKIVSVYYFFRSSQYDIVGYYLFCQTMILVGTLTFIFIVKKRFQYDFGLYFKSIKFSKEIFNKTKLLAATSLYGVISWILFYELDAFAIGKLCGAEMLGFYAIGLTFMQVFRTVFGILYMPFSARFNHFIGINNIDELKRFYAKIINLTTPPVIFAVITIIVLMKPFVLCWVGDKYIHSIVLSQLLISSYLLSFVRYPAGILITAQQKLKTMNVLATLLVVLYWGGIAATFYILQLKAFALFKMVSFTISGIAFLFISIKFISLTPLEYVKQTLLPLILPLFFLIGVLLFASPYLPLVKGKVNLLLVAGFGGVSFGLTLLLYAGISKFFRQEILGMVKEVLI